jgi:hypothetical protein
VVGSTRPQVISRMALRDHGELSLSLPPGKKMRGKDEDQDMDGEGRVPAPVTSEQALLAGPQVAPHTVDKLSPPIG